MAQDAITTTATPVATGRSLGRGYFWLGLAAPVLGLALFFGLFSLKILFTPWYAPALATLGVVLLIISVARRRTIARIIGLVLITVLAGFEWFVVLQRLPDYKGPAVGDPMPAFTAMQAKGGTFTDADLRDGSRRAMVFFRGRW
jgi:hypothetical protein